MQKMNSHSKNSVLWRILVILVFIAMVAYSSITIVQARSNLLFSEKFVVKEKNQAYGQVSGDTVVIEAADTVSWQEMLHYEANHSIEPEPPTMAPYMQPPESREFPVRKSIDMRIGDNYSANRS